MFHSNTKHKLFHIKGCPARTSNSQDNAGTSQPSWTSLGAFARIHHYFGKDHHQCDEHTLRNIQFCSGRSTSSTTIITDSFRHGRNRLNSLRNYKQVLLKRSHTQVLLTEITSRFFSQHSMKLPNHNSLL